MCLAAGSIPSPNMNMPIPQVGIQPGPQWATDINNSLTIIDRHDHTPGNGVQITPDGLNISSDLPFNGNNATLLRSTIFSPQGSPLSGPNDIANLYVSGVDLYYNDFNGNQIRLTQGGSIVGTSGSITGLVSPASASYVSGSATFVWQSNVNTAANMDAGSLILRNITPGSSGLTLAPPTLSSDYTITLPLLPASKKIVTLSNSGNMVADYDTDNVTLEVSSNNLQIKNLGVTAAKIANNTITTNQISLTAGITQGQLAAGALSWKSTTISATTATFAVRVATTVNGTLATAFDNGSPIDGVTLATSDLILIKNQTTASDNGVYVVQASGAPVRSTSYDTFTELNNAAVTVTAGTIQSRTSWYQNSTLTSLADSQSWSINSNWSLVVPTGVNEYFYAASGGGAGGGGAAGNNGSSNRGSGAGGSGAPIMLGHFAATSGETLTGVIGGFGRGGNGGATTVAGSAGTNGGVTTILSSVSGLNLQLPSGSGGGGGGLTTAGLAVNTVPVISGYDYWQGLIPTQAGTAGDGAVGNNASGGSANQNIYTTSPAVHGTTGGARGPSGGAGGSCFGAGGNGGDGNSPDSDGVTATNKGSGGGGAGGKANLNASAGKNGGDGAPGQIILYYLQGS